MSLGLVGPADRLSYVCTSATLAHENNRIASQFVNYSVLYARVGVARLPSG